MENKRDFEQPNMRKTVVYDDGTVFEMPMRRKHVFSSVRNLEKKPRNAQNSPVTGSLTRDNRKAWGGAIRAAGNIRNTSLPTYVGAGNFEYAFTLTAWGGALSQNGAALIAVAKSWMKMRNFRVICILEWCANGGFHIHGLSECAITDEMFNEWFDICENKPGYASFDYKNYDGNKHYCKKIENYFEYMSYVTKKSAETWMRIPKNTSLVCANFKTNAVLSINDPIFYDDANASNYEEYSTYDDVIPSSADVSINEEDIPTYDHIPAYMVNNTEKRAECCLVNGIRREVIFYTLLSVAKTPCLCGFKRMLCSLVCGTFLENNFEKHGGILSGKTPPRLPPPRGPPCTSGYTCGCACVFAVKSTTA